MINIIISVNLLLVNEQVVNTLDRVLSKAAQHHRVQVSH